MPSSEASGIVAFKGLAYGSVTGDGGTPAPPPPPGDGEVLTVVGDSIAAGIGQVLGQYLAPQGITVHNKGVGGTGPAFDAVTFFYDPWVGSGDELLPEKLANPNPDIVLCGFGGRSTVAGAQPGDDRWVQATWKGTRQIIKASLAGGRRVIWLAYPQMKSGGTVFGIPVTLPGEVKAWTEYRTRVRQEVTRMGVELVDLSPIISPNDKWVRKIGGVVVRAEDRIHLTDAGYRLCAAHIATRL